MSHRPVSAECRARVAVLIRISSLDELPDRAFAVHDEFIHDLLAGLAAEHRRRLTGAPG